MLTTGEAARFLSVSPKTLEGARYRHQGPAFHKMGGAVRYRSEALAAFKAATIREARGEAAKGA